MTSTSTCVSTLIVAFISLKVWRWQPPAKLSSGKMFILAMAANATLQGIESTFLETSSELGVPFGVCPALGETLNPLGGPQEIPLKSIGTVSWRHLVRYDLTLGPASPACVSNRYIRYFLHA